MDDALIATVYKREPLWNPENDLHKNAVVLKKLWEEVAFELQRDVKTIKSRWKNLRAYFFKELRKIEEKQKIDGADYVHTRTWHLYDQLLFLKVYPVTLEGDKCSVDYDDDSTTEEMKASINQEAQKKISMTTPSEDYLETKKRKLECPERENVKEKHDDLLFFESLLPYMSNIPLVPKLRLRSKIQDLILTELEAVENNG